jgi:hypothetical protein
LFVALSNGGITRYSGASIVSLSSSQIQVNVNVGAAAGSYLVQIVNPDGSVSNGVNLSVTAGQATGTR